MFKFSHRYRRMIAAHADVNAMRNDGTTVLMDAVRGGPCGLCHGPYRRWRRRKREPLWSIVPRRVLDPRFERRTHRLCQGRPLGLEPSDSRRFPVTTPTATAQQDFFSLDERLKV